jgi:succinate dehydrogenase/fumarate reductase flavoprotein subunit
MHHLIGAVVVGAVAGGAARNRMGIRSGLRRLVKGGIVAKRRVQTLGGAAVEEARKLVDEARADLDRPLDQPETERTGTEQTS